MAQVSINISDHEETPLHTVYEEVLKEAKVSPLVLNVHLLPTSLAREVMLSPSSGCPSVRLFPLSSEPTDH